MTSRADSRTLFFCFPYLSESPHTSIQVLLAPPQVEPLPYIEAYHSLTNFGSGLLAALDARVPTGEKQDENVLDP